MLDTEKLICSLVGIMSVSGHEEKGREELCSLVGGYFDEYEPHISGTHVFIKRCGRQNAPRLMIDTHFDEIGMLVSGIHPGGFLSVCSVGGLDRRIMPAAEVLIYGKKTLYGVICATPPHLQKNGDVRKNPEISQLRIDTGYSYESLREIVEIGTPVGFYPSADRLLSDRICSRSLDNKACCAAAVLAAWMTPKEKMHCDVYVTFSSKEETGLASGCSAAAYRIRPDAAIVSDVTFAQSPGVRADESGKLGGGPVLSMSAVTDRHITASLREIACRENIPCQICVDACDTGTNATALSLTGDGVPCAVVSVPEMSMHTYGETVSLADIENTARLFSAAMCGKEIFEWER